MTPKCPKCDAYIQELSVKTMSAKTAPNISYAGVVYCCPVCFAILGAGVDQVLLTNQILAEIRQR